jgi:uncharacterized protein
VDKDHGHAGALDANLRMRLREAMRGRDRAAVAVLRAALGAVDNGSAVPDDDRTQTERLIEASDAADVPRRVLSETEIRSIVSAELRDLEDAATEYREHGQDAAAATADYQASILLGVLGETE